MQLLAPPNTPDKYIYRGRGRYTKHSYVCTEYPMYFVLRTVHTYVTNACVLSSDVEYLSERDFLNIHPEYLDGMFPYNISGHIPL
jgi:hypothetical protein